MIRQRLNTAFLAATRGRVLGGGLVALIAMVPAAAISETATSASLRGEQAIAHLRREGSYDSLAAAMATARYAIHPVAMALPSTGEASYEALNPAENLRASFTATGVGLRSSTGGRPWQLGLELKGYGYGHDLVGLNPGAIAVQGNRIAIRKHAVHTPDSPALVEWYVNTPQGLEQGFTLPAPPRIDPRQSASARGRLRLALELTGDLRGETTVDGRAILLKDADGRHVSTYTHLVAWDATGRALEARMQVSGRELSLAVDDVGAQYPVTIDPTFREKQFQVKAPDGTATSFFGRTGYHSHPARTSVRSGVVRRLQQRTAPPGHRPEDSERAA